MWVTITEYTSFLRKYVAHKSISTDAAYSSDCVMTAQRLREQLEANKFDVEIIEWYGNPIIIASYHVQPSLPTCLVYGHYDVQPADLIDGRQQNPFDLEERDGRLYARGAIDNKWQLAVHLVTLFQLIKKRRLAYNIKVIIEGDEETWWAWFEAFMRDHHAKLESDVVLVSDGTFSQNLPALECGFRGGANFSVTMRTGITDQHSWSYGWIAPNVAHEASKLVAKLYDSAHHVAIPFFYYGVDDIDETIRKQNESLPFDEQKHQQETWYKAIVKEKEFDVYTQVWLRPTIQVTWIESWYTGEWFKNIIPATATIKCNCRFVQSQEPERVMQAIKQRVADQLPDYVDYQFEMSDARPASKFPIDSEFSQRAVQIIEEVYYQSPAYIYCGGSIPAIGLFQDYLKIPAVIFGLANHDSNMHGVDENFDLKYVERGLKFSEQFFMMK